MPSTPPQKPCALCKKPPSPTCMINGRTSPMLQCRHSYSNSTLNTFSPLPTPECPVCRQTIRVSCLWEKHIVPCRSCGSSYASTANWYRRMRNAGPETSAFDCGHDEAMAWLASLPRGPGFVTPSAYPSLPASRSTFASGSESPSPTSAAPTKALSNGKTKTETPITTTHPCIQTFSQTRDSSGNPITLGLLGFPEWDRQLSILNVSARGAWEGEVAAASKALHALREVCETITRTLSYVEAGDKLATPDAGYTSDPPPDKWSMVEATMRHERLVGPDMPWNRWYGRTVAWKVEGKGMEFGTEMQLPFIELEYEGKRLMALGDAGYMRVAPFAGRGSF
ncbi:hypothetical protein BDV06DRAFT_182459 [Aspergillus oleicola]